MVGVRVRACWVQVGALTARQSGAGHERPEFKRVDSGRLLVQLKALLAVVGQVLGQQRQQAGFLLSRRVQMTDPAFASADTTACANVFIIACNTSGDAPATCSHSRSTGFTSQMWPSRITLLHRT